MRAMSKRWASRLGIFHGRPSPAVAVFGVLFLTGLVTDRWVWGALLALAALWWAPPVWRSVRPWWTGRSAGGAGFNRQPDFDRILEERRPGVEGRITRSYWRGRRIAFMARYVPMAAMSTYVGGVVTRAYGLDVALVALRVLSPF